MSQDQGEIDSIGHATDAAPEMGVDPEKVASREKFFAGLRNDCAMPAVAEKIKKDARRFKPAPAINLSICLVGSDRLKLALDDIVDVSRLDTDDWRQQLAAERPAFVLVEADWLNAGDPWRERLIGPNAERDISDFVTGCRDAGIPAVFWFNKESAHVKIFEQALKLFDCIFASDVCLEAVRSVRPDAKTLPLYVDVGCFNPYKHRESAWLDYRGFFPVLMARAFQYMGVKGKSSLGDQVEKLFDQKFWLYEDRFHVRNNNQRMNPVERGRFLGCFDGETRASLLKTAVAELFPAELYASESPQARLHMLECMATKTIPVTDNSQWRADFPGSMRRMDRSGDFRDDVIDIAAHPIEAAICAHLNWRHVMTHNTYFEFVEEVCKVLGLPVSYDAPKEARFSFIMPTIRPDLIPMAVKFYQAQRYDNRELIIVLNTDDFDRASVERATDGDSSIQVLYAPADMPVGCAVNLGVLNMTGDYWAKMDDDDYYSPNYLSDINLYRKFLDFDIAGKGAIFNYFEGEDKTILRSSVLWDREIHHFAGGTLVVKNTPENVHWPERVRGYADIEFLTKRLVEGAHIASLDPFGHVQLRRTDSRFHTWTRQSSHMASDYVADGLSLESVFI